MGGALAVLYGIIIIINGADMLLTTLLQPLLQHGTTWYVK